MAQDIFIFDAETLNDSLDIGTVSEGSSSEFAFSGETDNPSLDIAPFAETSTSALTLDGETDNPSLDASMAEVIADSLEIAGAAGTYSDVLDGHYCNGVFYWDSQLTKPMPERGNTLYIDVDNNAPYRWDGLAFIAMFEGGGGGSDKNTVVIMPASNPWIINHSLNKFPSVTTIDSNGYEVFGDVEYVSLSRVVIRFDASFSGKAILN